MDDLTESLIYEIANDISGVGDKTVQKKLEGVNLDVSKENILFQLEDSFSSGVSVHILSELERLNFKNRDTRLCYSEYIMEQFFQRQYDKLENFTLDDLEEKINILLANSMGFDTSESLIRFYLYQMANRSSTTSWGNTVEKLCQIAGCKKFDENISTIETGKNPDVKKRKNGTTYYIQIKSGPNTMNVGMVNSLNSVFHKIEEEKDDAVAILGMTYGQKEHISSQISGSLDDFEKRIKIGREFWAFLSDSEDYYDEIVNIASELENDFNREYLNLLEDKVEELDEAWVEQYGTRDINSVL